MFLDTVQIKVQAGKGGDGKTSFRHEKHVSKGGPDGGDGGNGGHIIAEADNNLNTLSHFRSKKVLKAGDGVGGGKQKKHGKNGEDITLKVPVGTIISEGATVLADLTVQGQLAQVAKGGKGGFGNAHFTSSTRQAPRVAEVGEPGEAKELSLELKLIADVGLVGLPNAGKSTLISVVSNARPEIADYPFTTLTPHLGVVDIDDQSFLMADIPGLIKGASQGKGLGDEFLRHIERTSVLLHLIDATEPDVAAAHKTIQDELKSYHTSLVRKPQIVVLTKVDAISDKDLKAKLAELKKVTNRPLFAISAVAHKNLHKLLRQTIKLVKQEKRRRLKKPKTGMARITLADDPTAWWIEKTKAGQYMVKGQKIEGFATRTNMRSAAGVQRLRDILHKQGIDRELVRLGVALGDTVSIAGKKLKW